jgi:hypothetical protein
MPTMRNRPRDRLINIRLACNAPRAIRRHCYDRPGTIPSLAVQQLRMHIVRLRPLSGLGLCMNRDWAGTADQDSSHKPQGQARHPHPLPAP